MFAIERQRMIKNLLLKNRHVTVTQLSDCMNVSEVTIRRDLEKLEEEQFLMRTHGGAIILDQSGKKNDPSASAEAVVSEEGYVMAMAKLASNMIHDSNIVYLGSGKITTAMSQTLGNKQDLIVLTCSILAAAALYQNRNIQVILPGGTVLPNGMLYGPNVRNALDTMHMGIAFIEVSGFDSNGFTVRDQETCSLIYQVSRISDHLVFLCPAHAYGHHSVFKVGNLSIAHSIITTPDIDPAFKDACAKHNIPLFTAYEE